MKKSAVVGVGQGINGREAAIQAAQNALDQVGAARPVLALVFISQDFNVAEVLPGLIGLLGDTPIWGFSTIRAFTDHGEHQRSVVVALLTGNELNVQVQWWPNYSQDEEGVANQIAQNLRQETYISHNVLFVADGLTCSLETVCHVIEGMSIGVIGCLAAGEQALGKTYQIGNNLYGSGSLAMALLGGRFRVGAGISHGWRSTGAFFRVTGVQGSLINTIDGSPAVDVLVRLLGHTPREWQAPPLNDLARLYAFGMETDAGSSNLILRSILRVEKNGGLRMSAFVPEESVIHLMVGDTDACLEAARTAALNAIRSLYRARPLVAIALLDISWAYLFEAQIKKIIDALKEVLGDIPLVGAYTLGQAVKQYREEALSIHNQNIQLVLLGEGTD